LVFIYLLSVLLVKVLSDGVFLLKRLGRALLKDGGLEEGAARAYPAWVGGER
jgi:hypothetical protein